jgi:hypothetical protein
VSFLALLSCVLPFIFPSFSLRPRWKPRLRRKNACPS